MFTLLRYLLRMHQNNVSDHPMKTASVIILKLRIIILIVIQTMQKLYAKQQQNEWKEIFCFHLFYTNNYK